MIVAPTGEIVAQAATLGDEVIAAAVDLDRCVEIRGNVFDFAQHRQPAEYGLLTAPGPITTARG
jgi:predicted amidohydrolase